MLSQNLTPLLCKLQNSRVPISGAKRDGTQNNQSTQSNQADKDCRSIIMAAEAVSDQDLGGCYYLQFAPQSKSFYLAIHLVQN